ncbi:MAG TPA: HlyD family efflux transporter periplasmic adaptor subunit, partial [Gammaproteobacteria bacterium]|nr:HlyD family efflux transporter periplasmic adaptor subunit [Gammaproteobacteria bacterium]
PMPLTTSAEGVMWLPENGEVRAGTDGVLGEWLVAPGASVRAGEALAELDDPTVGVALATADSDVRSAEARYLAARATDAVAAASMLPQWQRAQAEYAAALERSESRSVTSPADGVLVVANPEDLPGRYFRQGDVIGYVVPPGSGTVLAVVPQDDIGLIRARVGEVQVRLSHSPAQVHRASIARLTPAGDFDLPSPALGTTGGGSVPVAPDDTGGRRSLTRVFRVELTLEQPFERLGGRALVRFDHGNEALALRGLRRLRQLFLRHFDA